jgi:hypothetical protein
MPAVYDLPNYLTPIPFIPAADVTTDGNGASFDLIPYEGKILVRADVGNATAGTTPTLDLVFKKSTDNTTFVNANIAFAQISNGGNEVVSIDPRALGENYRYLRVDKDITGANSPSYPVSVVGFGQRQYNKA